jgi:transcriptional regulator with XRE-family HTH domain
MEPHKRLQSWLDAAKITKAEMARRCGYDRSNFQRVVDGRLAPSLNLAAAIERETGKTILAADWATPPESVAA